MRWTNPAATAPVVRQVPHGTSVGAAHAEAGTLEVAEGVGHRRPVRRPGRPTELPRGQQMQDADRLRGGEHQVEAGHRPRAAGEAQDLVARRVAAGQDPGEVGAGDGALQPEFGGAPPGPDPR